MEHLQISAGWHGKRKDILGRQSAVGPSRGPVYSDHDLGLQVAHQHFGKSAEVVLLDVRNDFLKYHLSPDCRPDVVYTFTGFQLLTGGSVGQLGVDFHTLW